jgi:AcrR family transcriptional regulator
VTASVEDQSTHERILAAAARLFARQGYDGTTTRDIVKEAGSSLSSIQFHFQSKHALYREVLERTLSTFYRLNAPVLSEIDEMQRQGLVNENSAWDLIVQLTGQVADWAFTKEYADTILLINREMLNPGPVFKVLPDSLLGLYRYYQELYEAYTGVKGALWAKGLSFSVVSTLFDFANYPDVLGQVLGFDSKAPENKLRIKTHIKGYLLSAMRVYLNERRQETSPRPERPATGE